MNWSWSQFWKKSQEFTNSNFFSVALILTFGIGFWLVRDEIYVVNKERLVHEFEVESKTVMLNLEDTLKEYADLLYTMRGLIMASEEVTRSEWAEYAKNVRLKEDYKSVTALEYIRRVKGEEITNFENKVNQEIRKNDQKLVFKVTPSGARSEYYVADYLEPYWGNEKAWGYDLYSDASRRKTVDLARDTNEVMMSEPVNLVQEKENQKGLLLMLPVYKKGVDVETLVGRRNNIIGMVLLVSRVPDLLTATLSKEVFTSLNGVIINDLSTEKTLVSSKKMETESKEGLELMPEVYKERLTFGSKIWELSFRSNKKAEVVGIDMFIPYLFMIIGIVVTLFQRWQMRSIMLGEERLSSVIKGSRAGTWEWNVQTGETIFNERWAEILGYTLKELEPISIKTWEKLALPEDLAKSDELLNKHFEGKTDYYEFESRMKHKNGSLIWVADRGQLVSRDFKGRPLKMIGIHLDITAAKEAEEKLRRSQAEILSLSQRNEAILFSIGDGVLACDKEGKVVVFNKMAETLTSLTRTGAEGRHYSQILVFVNEKTGLAEHDLIGGSLVNGEIINVSTNIVLKKNDGTLIPIAVSAAPVKDAGNTILGCVVVFKDMTMQRSMDKAKTEFVMEASHHLRTPLSAINWYTSFLQDEKNGSLSKEQTGLVEEIRKAGARMTDLTNSLLNVARLEMGNFSVEPFLVKLTEVVKQSVAMFKPQIQKKNLNFVEQYETGDEMYMLDPKLLAIVIQNVLSNAVNYTTDGGSINLTVRKENGEIKIVVSDTGIGIPLIDRGRVYEKFYRSDSVKQINPSGMGLGLFVAKEIVDSSGGNISFLSEEGKGTTFWVTYPETGMKSVNGAGRLNQ